MKIMVDKNTKAKYTIPKRYRTHTMPNDFPFHARISRPNIVMHLIGGLMGLGLCYLLSQEPPSTDRGGYWLERSIIVASGLMAAYAFLRPLWFYRVSADGYAITLTRWGGRQKIEILWTDIVSCTHEHGPAAWYSNVGYNELALRTDKAKYVLYAADYANFDEMKRVITKSTKRKY